MRIKSYRELIGSHLWNIPKVAFDLALRRTREIVEMYYDNHDIDNERSYFWVFRDQLRLQSGYWTPISDDLIPSGIIDPRYALHVSRTNPKLVCYTPFNKTDKAQQDTVVVTKLGKFLTANYSDRFSGPMINGISNRFSNREIEEDKKEGTPRYTLEEIKGPKKIAEMYMECFNTGLGSCMTKGTNQWSLRPYPLEPQNTEFIHPTEVYGHSPDMALLMLYDNESKKWIARVMANTNTRKYGRIYGNADIAREILADKGYFSGDFEGAELPLIKAQTSRNVPPAHMHGHSEDGGTVIAVMPYLDGNNRVVWDEEKRKFILTTDTTAGKNGGYSSGGIPLRRCSHCNEPDPGISRSDAVNNKYQFAWTLQADDSIKGLRLMNVLLGNNARCPACIAAAGNMKGAPPEVVRGITKHRRYDPSLNNYQTASALHLKSKMTRVNAETLPGWHHQEMWIETDMLDDITVPLYGTDRIVLRNYVVQAQVTPDSDELGWFKDEETIFDASTSKVVSKTAAIDSGLYWVYKYTYYRNDDCVEAIFTRDKKKAKRPLSRCFKHENKEEYYDKDFAHKYMSTYFARNPDGTKKWIPHTSGREGSTYLVSDIRPLTDQGIWRANAVQRTGSKYTSLWVDETPQAETQAAA